MQNSHFKLHLITIPHTHLHNFFFNWWVHKDKAAVLSPAPKSCCVFFACEPSQARRGTKTISKHLWIAQPAAAGRIWVYLWKQGPDEYCLSVSLISAPRGTLVMSLLRRVPEHLIALTCVRMDYSDCFALFWKCLEMDTNCIFLTRQHLKALLAFSPMH